MSYRLVIFDFDGTLADSGEWMVRMLNEAAARFRIRRVTDEEIQTLRGLSNREIVRYFRVPAWKMPRIAAYVRRRMAEDADQIRLFPGVSEMLWALKAQGVRIAAVSSNSEDNLRYILGPANASLIDDFDCGAGLFGKARKFRRVMKRADVSPEQTLCVGDETRDIEAAKAVGAAAGAVTWGYATPEVLASFKPTLTFEALDQIPEAIGI
jgi:phosphoglycolate phosphatase